MKRLMEEIAQEKVLTTSLCGCLLILFCIQERERLASIDKTHSALSRTSSSGSVQVSFLCIVIDKHKLALWYALNIICSPGFWDIFLDPQFICHLKT